MADATPPAAGWPGTALLHAIVARARRRAVVFRRGLGKLVRLLLWELGSDTLVGGQWFKGRIYERRCDLNPDGTMLCYFAANHRKPYGTWTAISRPPYLTALALWPKGDAWGGGGLFARPGLLELNHAPEACGALPMADGFRLPPGLAVCPMGDRPGGGENAPIETRRLQRDGWTVRWPTEAGATRGGRKSAHGWTFDPPGRSCRPVGRGARLAVLLHAINERQGRWEVQTAVIEHGAAQRDLGRVDWADADHNGDVLYAANGCLRRVKAPNLPDNAPMLVAELNAIAFEPVETPPEALR